MQKKRPKILFALLVAVALIYGALVGYAYFPANHTVDPQSLAGPESHFVVVEGKRIHYVQQGSGSPVVLIHGFGGSTYTWRKLMPLLATKHTAVALDLPGFGLSDKPPRGDYSLAAQARTVLGFLDVLSIAQPTLIGHSMGGVIAASAAVQRPAHIGKLVLVEPGFYHGRAPAFLKYLIFPLPKIFAKSFYTPEGRSRTLTSSFYHKELVTDELLNAYLLAGKTPHAIDALAHMMRTVSDESYDTISTRITTPTLLVWSRHNPSNPLSDGERLHREIQGSTLVVLEDSGHYIQEEQPVKLAQTIFDFID